MSDLDYLIQVLLDRRKEKIKLPTDLSEKKKLYKKLVNLQEPFHLSEEFIKKENAYLQSELKQKVPIDLKMINISKNNISVWKGDITRLKVDAIVNPANHQGLGCFNPSHICLDNMIGVNAGLQLRNECNEIMKQRDYYLPTGEAFITKGYNLPCKYIIHTVGPEINTNVTETDVKKLRACYQNSLKLASGYKIRTIAFPCISTGLFAFPKDKACEIAIKAVYDYLNTSLYSFDRIIFCVYTFEDLKLYEENI